ncbi:MAG: DUF262 domain-containing protein [Clostridiales bacterium]|nr:DUF262 domain-containing protein [Clostridiales bacterium]
MSDSNKICLRYLKENYKKGLLIPEIQRDYVMGSGGEKLDKLLDAIKKKYEANEDFDFSCIITYCENENNDEYPLQIYDGQQRLTTLLLMVLYRLHIENKKAGEYKGWYSFKNRNKANEIFNSLAAEDDEASNIFGSPDETNKSGVNINIMDFTTFSIKNLLDKFSGYDIPSDYLLNNVKFEMVSIGSQNEIEQFFLWI